MTDEIRVKTINQLAPVPIRHSTLDIVRYCRTQIEDREHSLQADNTSPRRSLRLVSEIGAYTDVITFIKSSR
jgi:hypothetical protein